MARVVETVQRKNKNKRKKFIVFIILLLLLTVGGLCFYKFYYNKPRNKAKVRVEILDSLDDYNYSLSDRDSTLYKEEFELLKSVLNEKDVDEEKYSQQIAKLFIIDLYTMSTKMNKYDIGGVVFYNSKKKSMYEKKVMDTLYSSLLDDTYGDRKQELPEVKTIEIVSTEKVTYKLGDEKVNGYLVKLKWTFVKNMGYDTQGSVVLCKETDKIISVVDYQPTLTPKYS